MLWQYVNHSFPYLRSLAGGTPLQAISIVFFAWISDKYRHRALFIAVQTLVTLIGLCLTGFASAAGWRYAGSWYCLFISQFDHDDTSGIFLSNAGCSGCIPAILAYVSQKIFSLHINILDHAKLSVEVFEQCGLSYKASSDNSTSDFFQRDRWYFSDHRLPSSGFSPIPAWYLCDNWLSNCSLGATYHHFNSFFFGK